MIDLEIAIQICAREMGVGLVRADDDVDHCLDVAVGEDGDFLFHAHRPCKTHGRAGHLVDHVRGGQFDFRRSRCLADLAFVGFVVAAHEHGNRPAVGRVDQRLDNVLRFAGQKLAHLFDGRGMRGVHFFKRFARHIGRDAIAGPNLGLFLVGRVAAILAVQDGVLAVLGQRP